MTVSAVLNLLQAAADVAGFHRSGSTLRREDDAYALAISLKRHKFDSGGEKAFAPLLEISQPGGSGGVIWGLRDAGAGDDYVELGKQGGVSMAAQLIREHFLEPLGATRESKAVEELFWAPPWGDLRRDPIGLTATRLALAGLVGDRVRVNDALVELLAVYHAGFATRSEVEFFLRTQEEYGLDVGPFIASL